MIGNDRHEEKNITIDIIKLSDEKLANEFGNTKSHIKVRI